MLVQRLEYVGSSWRVDRRIVDRSPDIVFLFGRRAEMLDGDIYRALRDIYPYSDIVGCSSSGNILGDRVTDAKIVASAIYFDKGSVRVSIRDFSKWDNQLQLGKDLILALPKGRLKHIFIMADGLKINGSKLIEGRKYGST